MLDEGFKQWLFGWDRPSRTDIPTLLRLLSHRSWILRCHAARRLGQIDWFDPAVVAGLAGRLTRKHRGVQQAALESLIALARRHHEALPAVIAALRSSDTFIRERAAQGLGELGYADQDVIAALRPMADEGIGTAMIALGRLRYSDATFVDLLWQQVAGENGRLPHAAAIALGLLGYVDEPIPALLVGAYVVAHEARPQSFWLYKDPSFR